MLINILKVMLFLVVFIEGLLILAIKQQKIVEAIAALCSLNFNKHRIRR